MIGMISAALFCGWGHIIRDGEPSFKNLLAPSNPLYHLSTQLARASGALACAVGLAPAFGWHAILFGFAILIGFYIDMRHGEGQGATSLKDAAYLTLSGVTSVLPLAVLCAWELGPWHGLIGLVGFLKPGVWFATAPFPRFFTKLNMYTTEAAAGIFGAMVGVTLAAIS